MSQSRGEDPQEFPIEMSHSVPADTGHDAPNRVERTPHQTRHVEIMGVVIGWPAGAQNAVGVQIRAGGGEKLLPRNNEDQYIAADDFNHPFRVRFVLDPDEDLVAETVNFDATNAHFVNIIPEIRVLNQAQVRG